MLVLIVGTKQCCIACWHIVKPHYMAKLHFQAPIMSLQRAGNSGNKKKYPHIEEESSLEKESSESYHVHIQTQRSSNGHSLPGDRSKQTATSKVQKKGAAHAAIAIASYCTYKKSQAVQQKLIETSSKVWPSTVTPCKPSRTKHFSQKPLQTFQPPKKLLHLLNCGPCRNNSASHHHDPSRRRKLKDQTQTQI